MVGVGDDDSYVKPPGRWPVFYYGAGHMLNDITAACWFTYLLLFLTDIGLSPSHSMSRIPVLNACCCMWVFFAIVVTFPNRDAAIVMLSGQVADGIATIFAGELIDRFGHFKVWHAAGTVLVAVSFSSVFGGCIPCKIFANDSLALQTIGYSIFAAIFNVGWAATQVSHMSMINCITLHSSSRVVLASCRNAFTMVANLSLYAVAIVVFAVTRANSPIAIENQYRWIGYVSIFIGCCFVAVFHFGTKEPRLKFTVDGASHARISWIYWFKKVLYYQVALVYVLTRLVLNVSQAYLAFYVINDLHMPQTAKALVPAIIYISSFIVSVILQEIAWTSRRLKAYYSVGAILWIICGAGIIILPQNLSSFMYLIAIFIGIANALMTVTGISLQTVLVGEDLNGCAFVCGSLSFLDKIACGMALYILQSYQTMSPNKTDGNLTAGTYVSVTRLGLGLVPAVCSLAGMFTTYTMELHPYSSSSKSLVEPLLE